MCHDNAKQIYQLAVFLFKKTRAIITRKMIILIALEISQGVDGMNTQSAGGKVKFGICSSNLDLVRDLAMDTRAKTLNLVFAQKPGDIKKAVQILLADGCKLLYLDGSEMGFNEVVLCGTSSFLCEVEKVVVFNATDRVHRLIEMARTTSWDCGQRVHILPDPVDARALIEVHLPWERED